MSYDCTNITFQHADTMVKKKGEKEAQKYLYGEPIENLRRLALILEVSADPGASKAELIAEITCLPYERLLQELLRDDRFNRRELLVEVDRRTDQKLKTIEQLKWLFTAIGSAIALIVLIGSIFGVSRLTQLAGVENRYRELADKHEDSLHKTQRELDKLVVERAMRVASNLFPEVRLDLLGDEALAQIRDQRSLLSSILDVTSSSDSETSATRTETQQLLAVLLDRYSALEQLPDAYTDDSQPILERQTEQWRKMTMPLFSDPFLRRHSERLEAWRNGVLANIELRKYRKLDDYRSPATLLAADTYANNAIEHDPQFARAHVVRAMIVKRRLDQLLKGDGGIDEKTCVYLVDGLEEAIDLLDDALKYPQSDRSRASIMNNAAFYSVLRANVEYRRAKQLANDPTRADHIRRARLALENARRRLAYASAFAEAHPTIYSTQAELLCMAIPLDIESGTRDFRGEERFEEVLGLLEKAVEAGYTGFKNITFARVLEVAPVYRHLAKVGPADWKKKLEDTIGAKKE